MLKFPLNFIAEGKGCISLGLSREEHYGKIARMDLF